MGNFGEHVRAGAVVALFVVAAGAFFDVPITFKFVAIGAVLALLGSIVPDIDAQSSIPRRYLGTAVVVLAVGGAIWYGIQIPSLDTVQIIAMAGVALVAAVVGLDLFDDLTTHRGFFHSIGFVALAGSVVYALTTMELGFSDQSALFLGACLAVGIVVHVYIIDG